MSSEGCWYSATHPNKKPIFPAGKVFEFFLFLGIFLPEFSLRNQLYGVASIERWSLDATSCQQDLCCVCVTEPKDAALVPCGHKARMAGGSQSSVWVDCQKAFRCLYCWLFMLFMLFMLLSSFASFSSLPLLCLFLQAMCYNCACQVQARGHWLMQLLISGSWKVRRSSRHSATCLRYVTVRSPMYPCGAVH